MIGMWAERTVVRNEDPVRTQLALSLVSDPGARVSPKPRYLGFFGVFDEHPAGRVRAFLSVGFFGGHCKDHLFANAAKQSSRSLFGARMVYSGANCDQFRLIATGRPASEPV